MMSFPLLLVLLTFVTGGIWLLDVLVLRKRRMKAASEVFGDLVKAKYDSPAWVEYSRSFFPIFLVVLLLRSFLVEPFRIPSASMNPTLLEGDFIVVNKYQYGLRLPVIGTKIIGVGHPKRGDIIVFHHKSDNKDMIKRVVGLPGEHILYKDKVLYINQVPVNQVFKRVDRVTYHNGMTLDIERFVEQLEGQEHDIYLSNFVRREAQYNDLVIPKGHYFVMGDNRDNSEDSRSWGLVSDKQILGKAFATWMSWDSQHMDLRWERIGKPIS